MSRSDFVSVTIVTYNSGRFIKRCLESVLDQKYPFKEIIVIDNNSSDGTIDILEPFEDREGCRIFYNAENVGFAAAQNQAISYSNAEWVLTLNPDVLLLQGFLEALVNAGNLDPRVGTVCGKLLTMTAGFDFPEEPLVDSTGIYFTPNLRHLDRGSLQVDNGHFREYEYVFGATAAAALYRREMIDDIAIKGEFFDEDFFVYREDADVAWRAQLMGWKCLYAPYAKGYHVRKALPGNRRALPPEINMHSVKNRFLLRMKNISWDLYRRNFLSITLRDLVVISCCLIWEHTSLKRLPIRGAELAQGDRETPRDHGTQARGRRIHRQLVQLRTGKQAGTEEIRRGDDEMRRPRGAEQVAGACASRYSAPAAYRPNYGGFETFAEELPSRLVARGHEVTVYCRETYELPKYRGVDLHPLPTIRHKYLDTLSHTFVSTLHLLTHRADAAALLQRRQRGFHHPPAPCRYARSAQRRRNRTRRKKWNRARARLVSHVGISRDHPAPSGDYRRRSHQSYYLETYGKRTPFSSLTAPMPSAPKLRALCANWSRAARYFLYVSRMEPENRALEVRQAFEQVPTRSETGADRRRALRRASTSAGCATPRTRGW